MAAEAAATATTSPATITTPRSSPPRTGASPSRKRKKYIPVKDIRYITTFLEQWKRRESDTQLAKCAERCPMVHAEALTLCWDTLWFLNDPKATWLIDLCVKLINAFPEKDAEQRGNFFLDCWRHIEGQQNDDAEKKSTGSGGGCGNAVEAADQTTRSAVKKRNRASCIAYKTMQKLLSENNPFQYGSKSIDSLDQWTRQDKGMEGKDGIVGYVANETVKSFPFLRSAAAVARKDHTGNEKEDVASAEKALEARLEFMLYLASKKEDLYITQDTLKSLFVSFGACDTLLSWFKRLLPKSSVSYSPPVTQDTLRFIFTDLVCGSIPPQTCSSSGFSCFRYFFLHGDINGSAITTEYHRPADIRQVRHRDWPGKDFLWGCMLSADSDVVAGKARDLYLKLVKSMTISSGLREERDEGLSAIFDKLAFATQSVMEEDGTLEASGAMLSQSRRESLRACTLAMRLLSSLVLDCVMKSPSAMKQTRAAVGDTNSRINRHGARGRGSPMKLRVYVEKLYTSCPGSNFDIDVHGKVSMQRLMKMINERPECTPFITTHSMSSTYKVTKLRHRMGGTFEKAEDELRVLDELGFRDGDAVTCNWAYFYQRGHHTTSRVNYTGYTHGTGANSKLPVGENNDNVDIMDPEQGALRSLVHLEKHMDVLFTLVQTMTTLSAKLLSLASVGSPAAAGDEGASKSAAADREQCDLVAAEGWAFLQSLPTHVPTDNLFRSLVPTTTARVSDAAGEQLTPFSASSWEELLSCAPHDFIRTSYRLQIVDALLLPANKTESEIDEDAKAWRRAFLASGGFKAILEILLFHTAIVNDSGRTDLGLSLRNTVGHPVTNICFAVALRIAKFCLLGGFVGRGVDIGVQSMANAVTTKEIASLTASSNAVEETNEEITWANDNAVIEIEMKTKNRGGSVANTTKESQEELQEEAKAGDDGVKEFVIPAVPSHTTEEEDAMRVAFPPLMRSFSESSTSRTLDDIDLALVLRRLILIVASVFPVANEDDDDDDCDTRLRQHCKRIARVDLHKRREMALNCLVMMRGILKSSADMIAEFLSPLHEGHSANGSGSDALVPLLLYATDYRLRESILKLFEDVAVMTPPLLFPRLFAPVQRNFGRLSTRRPADPTQFFKLFERMLQHIRKSRRSADESGDTLGDPLQDDLNGLFNPSSMLDALIARIRDYDPNDEEHVLSGYLRLVRTVVEGDSKENSLPVPFEKIEALLDLLFDVCLFNVPTISAKNTAALCTSRTARRAVFDVFRCLAEKSVNIRAVILERVESFRMTVRAHFEETLSHPSSPPEDGKAGEDVINSERVFPLATDEDLTKNLDRNATGYVGLKNQGATCYMNATLQVLNLDPVFRQLVHEVDGKALMRRIVEKKNQEEKESSPEAAAAAEGRGGRGGGGDDQKGEEKDLYSAEALMEDADASKLSVLTELQKCLLYLQEGRMHYYDARPLVMASKTLNLLNDVLHQNDVRDYADKLMDRLEEALALQDSAKKEADRSEEPAEQASKSKSTDSEQEGKRLGALQSIFTSRFKGIWATETHRLGDNIPEEHAVSSRTEPFFALAATIKNHSGGVGGKQPFFTNLEESLVDSVKGERMEGENQLNCDFLPRGDDGKTVKCNGVRRMFIEKLPEVMLIHLKRFEYDVSTYNIAKVKQKFEFPMSLNMFRYTRAGVAAATEKESREEAKEEEGGMAKKEEVEQLTKDGEAGGESKGTNDDSDPKEEGAGTGATPADVTAAAEDSAAIASDPAFDYELVGVIVHNGASEQSGHYYSYALVPSDSDDSEKNTLQGTAIAGNAEPAGRDDQSGKWFKFNDKIVTPFNPSAGAGSEWFGGKSDVPVINQYTGEQVGNSTRLEFRNNSAYMLVYRRKSSSRPGAVGETNADVTLAALKMHGGPSATPSDVGQVAALADRERVRLLSQIWHENDLAIRTRWLFDPEFFSFMRDILVMAASSTTDGGEGGGGGGAAAAEGVASKTASIIKVAVEFFINVVIKGKDKTGLNRWVEVIASLLVSSPAAAVHILESASSRSYVQEKIIRQSLPELRSVFSDLCLSAIQALVPAIDSIEDQAELQKKEGGKTKLRSAGVDPSENLNARAQALLDLMVCDPEDVPSSVVAGVSYDDVGATAASMQNAGEAVGEETVDAPQGERKKTDAAKDESSSSLSSVEEGGTPQHTCRGTVCAHPLPRASEPCQSCQGVELEAVRRIFPPRARMHQASHDTGVHGAHWLSERTVRILCWNIGRHAIVVRHD